MAASAFGAGADRNSDHRAAGSAAKPSSSLPDPQLLESVLRETLSSGASGQPLVPEEWQALRDVVQRHRGAPFSRNPVVSDLIAALLRERLTGWKLAEAAQREITGLIADTLYEDAASRDRLRAMWENLAQMPGSENPT
ncbi:MAG: hypothetical protein KF708_00705 [Pirellulales bacterium]|nr:hypothetical protein [Pirellulales bacterium]